MWDKLIKAEKAKPYYKKLTKKVNTARLNNNVYPADVDVFRAFKLTPFNEVKVVIIGQDPYHGPNQAHGLAFSSLDFKTPKSLANIKKELISDLGYNLSSSNDLSNWAKQGVLLLNTILTVDESKPFSHKGYGWEIFTLNMLKELCRENRPLVFILWGNEAISYEKYITNNRHLILKSSHPSPLSAYRTFFGSKPFSQTNNYLIKHNLPAINFNI